jgi:hypothetical protein
MTNLNRGISFQVALVNGPALCRQDADWIVEDFASGGQPVPFSRFDDVWFEECSATTARGNTVTLDGAQQIYMGNGAASSATMCAAFPYDGSNFYCQSQN